MLNFSTVTDCRWHLSPIITPQQHCSPKYSVLRANWGSLTLDRDASGAGNFPPPPAWILFNKVVFAAQAVFVFLLMFNSFFFIYQCVGFKMSALKIFWGLDVQFWAEWRWSKRSEEQQRCHQNDPKKVFFSHLGMWWHHGRGKIKRGEEARSRNCSLRGIPLLCRQTASI